MFTLMWSNTISKKYWEEKDGGEGEEETENCCHLQKRWFYKVATMPHGGKDFKWLPHGKKILSDCRLEKRQTVYKSKKRRGNIMVGNLIWGEKKPNLGNSWFTLPWHICNGVLDKAHGCLYFVFVFVVYLYLHLIVQSPGHICNEGLDKAHGWYNFCDNCTTP